VPLSFYLKAIFTTGTYHKVLALCLRETEDRLASGALAIDVSFSVAEFILAESEEAAELVVFTLACRNVP
jgi:hypothetical protein